MSTQIQITPKSGLTIGTTAIASGTVGRVLFQGTGNVLQQSPRMTFDAATANMTIGQANDTSVNMTVFSRNANPFTIADDHTTFGATNGGLRIVSGLNGPHNMFRIRTALASGFNQTDFITGGVGNGNVVENSFMNVIGYNTDRAGEITLRRSTKVLAPSALSTDIAFRVRNSADTANLLSVAGNGEMIFNGNGISFNGNNGSNIDLNTSFYDNSGFRIGLDDYGNNTVIMTNRIQNSKINRLDNIYNSGLGGYYGAYQGYTVNVLTSQFSGAYTSYLSHSTSKFVIGSTTAGARLDVRAQGALSTDIAFRVRNSADSANIISVRGDNKLQFGSSAANWIQNDGDFQLGSFVNYSTLLGWFGGAIPYQYQGATNTSMLRTNSTQNVKFVSISGGTTNGILNNFGTSNIALTDANLVFNGTKTFTFENGTAPTLSYTDSFQQYSADIVAGNAAPHFRTENGSIIKLYKQDLPTNPTNAQIATLLSNLGLANLI
jgi:hypothetical protein